jgi:hypothetical protein
MSSAVQLGWIPGYSGAKTVIFVISEGNKIATHRADLLLQLYNLGQ